VNALVAALAGVLFALGLALSGMTQPKAVIGFLDFFGRWNPSLAFVMVGAIGVYALGRRLVLQRPAPLYDTTFHPPIPAPIFAPRLIGGSALFGIGWGLAGYCPGPSLVALGTGAPAAIVFVSAMVGGTLLERIPGLFARGEPRHMAVTDS
jgi:uncharacterized membrane protein YedE/YeeE